MGTLAGILMLIALAAFSYQLFEYHWIAVPVVLIFAFDFMHFTHTRLAQVDSFLVLFIICMFYFLYRYGRTLYESEHSFQKPIMNLVLMGVNLGWQSLANGPVRIVFRELLYCFCAGHVIH